MYKNKEHTFVIFNGIITSAEWVFRKMGQKISMALDVTLEAPAAVLTKTDTPAAAHHARLVLSDGTEKALANATINGHLVDLVKSWAINLSAPAAVLTAAACPADQQPVCLVLSNGTERPLVNATINGSTVELAAL